MLDIFKFIFSYLISNFILVLNISAVGLPNYYILYYVMLCVYLSMFLLETKTKYFRFFFSSEKNII